MYHSRRRFLRDAGTTLAASTFGTGALAQTGRKRVSIGGRNARVVDIHAHCVFPELGPMIAGTNLEGIGFPEFVTLSPARLDAMDQRGIDIQALSVNAFWWYRADRSLARRGSS